MKTNIPYILLALAASGLAYGVETAYTTPVGYITHSIAGKVGDYSDTYLSPTLVRSIDFAGAATASPSGGMVITFSGGVPTNLDELSVLEITSATGEGWWSTVDSSTSTTITVHDNFPAGLSAGMTVAVRKHSTLGSFLGENAPGLITFNGVDPNDEVQILNASGQVVSSYAYVSGPDLADPNYPNGAWFDLLNSVVANDTMIEPGTSLKVKRIGNSALSFVSTGTVKTSKTQVDLFTNFNWVGTPSAAGNTLNGMTFQNQLIQFDGVNPNYDELQYVRANQVVQPYAAVDDGGPTMFDLTNSVSAGNEPFPEGTGVIIKRIGNLPSTITLPGTVVGP